MKVILLALLLTLTIDFTRSSATDSDGGTDKCTYDTDTCQREARRTRRQIWLANYSDNSCYNISVTGCEGIGYNTLSDCFWGCFSE
uniref:Pancreatic trypsin inhibitor n=1 Tax=Rhipicephalus appendiculatus TaxID=34631 RepID=A0A131YBF6_RHIAP